MKLFASLCEANSCHILVLINLEVNNNVDMATTKLA